jgi:SAM-dependent methyltransferase
MHPRIYQEFERICTERPIRGSVLEVGAEPNDTALLCMKSLQGVSHKVGLNLDSASEYKDFKILSGNANAMDCFEDNQFDAVLCSSTLEHDKYFWKSLSEIKRVTKPGGMIVIGVPGYTKTRVEKIKALWSRIPLIRKLQAHQYLNMFFTSTVTFCVHNWPGDYYRFSPQAMREVFLEGLENTEVRAIMLPPRIIGIGFKPAGNSP